MPHSYAQEDSQSRFSFERQRGLAACRICEDLITNAEVRDKETGQCWPAFGPEHYLLEHNVYPSKAFYEYVMCTMVPGDAGL